MNFEKLIENFLYKVKAELTDIKMSMNNIESTIIGSTDQVSAKLAEVNKAQNWLEDVINEIEEVLRK